MKRHWNFLTNHAHVLICMASGDGLTLREIADQIGITERTTSRIVNELEQEGAIERTRRGRRNLYEINDDFPLRHPLERHCSVGQLVRMVAEAPRGDSD